jgi:sugar lactone lactonase YvrE
VNEVRLVQAEQAITGESPLWDDRRQVLWWIDIQGKRLLGWRESSPLPALALPSEPGLVALSEDSNLVLGLEDGLWRYIPERDELNLLTPIDHGRAGIRLNDGKPDRQGRLWFGSMDKSGSGVPVGRLYCRYPGGDVRIVREGVRVPNAITVSPDGATLYFSDSPSQEVLAFNLNPATGVLGDARLFARFEGNEKPDGTAVDAQGDIWIAVVHGARIAHLGSAGAEVASIPLPVTKPTMPAFGGPAHRTLFVTSQRRFLDAEELARQPAAGGLLAAGTETAGLPPFRIRL